MNNTIFNESEFPYYLLEDRRIISNRDYWLEHRRGVKHAPIVKDHNNPKWLRENEQRLMKNFLREKEGWFVGCTKYRYRWMVG
jgi:hypothetical protein